MPEPDHNSVRDSTEASAIVTAEEQETGAGVGFQVVALGASAGGLEAFRLILQSLPSNTGMAFVLIQHLSPQHASQLPSLLAQATSMTVSEVEHGVTVKPNQVFVIPPNKVMNISRGVLELTPRENGTRVPMPIDHFFRSLARDQRGGAIGVVLSGSDSDGALGLQSIREEGGISITQSEESAKFSAMPHHAALAGPVDLILPPEQIASELGRIAGNRSLFSPAEAGSPKKPGLVNSPDEHHLNAILALLQKQAGIDFRDYKRATVDRRIQRRMLLHRHANLAAYAAHLETNTAEAMALYEDVLINVTGFFRDPDTFLALQNQVLPELLASRSPGAPLRVWVPGCSTGQEVYSIAVCLVEAVSNLPSPIPIQLFGTDLSDQVLAKARAGIYQENQLAEIPEERRRKFFTPVQNGFQVVKSIRELCVFARQNVCVDPPFSRLDLVSCRNLLIYLASEPQRHVVATLHHALKPGGYLMLGRSETLRGFPELFSSVDKHHKFFKRTTGGHASSEMVGRGFARERSSAVPATAGLSGPQSQSGDFQRLAERIVLREYGPPWVMVNGNFEILHSRGDTSVYLQLPTGPPSFNLLKMAREGLRGELQKLLTEAATGNFIARSSTVREISDGEIRSIVLGVRRLPDQAAKTVCFLVTFSPAPERTELAGIAVDRATGDSHQQAGLSATQSAPPAQSPETELLRDELALTSQRLQSIIDERDAANHELTSANEEIQSSNEELRSINEELETAKEELQSSNEELSTLNEELQNRNQELSRLSDDLSNLMSSTTIPILLLDNDLRIRRMTPTAESLLGIRPGDLGRPIGDFRLRLSVEDIESPAREVLATLQPIQLEMQDRENHWRELRLRPYRTADSRIAGVVLTLIDIHQLRQANQQAARAREFAESVIEAVKTPLLVLRSDLRIRLANRAFYSDYDFQPADVENQSLLELGRHQWDLPGLRSALSEALQNPGTASELEFETEFAGLGKKTVCIYMRRVQPEGEALILVALEDLTAQKNAASILVSRQEQLKSRVEEGTVALRETESALLRSRGELRGLAANLLNAQEEERRRISRELHDDLSQKVAKLQFDIETLEQNAPFSDVDRARQMFRHLRDQAGSLADDLRRVARGLHPSSLDHLGLPVALRSYAEEFSRSTAIPVRFTTSGVPRDISLDVASCLYRIVQEALRNVGKHAPAAKVEISVSASPQALDLSIRDDGDGFDSQLARESGGLGLISMHERVRLVQGQFSLDTKPGQGVHISVRVPLHSEPSRPEAL